MLTRQTTQGNELNISVYIDGLFIIERPFSGLEESDLKPLNYNMRKCDNEIL